MKTALRIVAIVIGFMAFRVGLSIVQDASSGDLTVWWRSGEIGADTLSFWAVILIVGPVAAVQLWRLRRIGLSATALLGALWLVLALAGLFLRTPGKPVESFIPSVLIGVVLLALVISPAARRACRDGHEDPQNSVKPSVMSPGSS